MHGRAIVPWVACSHARAGERHPGARDSGVRIAIATIYVAVSRPVGNSMHMILVGDGGVQWWRGTPRPDLLVQYCTLLDLLHALTHTHTGCETKSLDSNVCCGHVPFSVVYAAVLAVTVHQRVT